MTKCPTDCQNYEPKEPEPKPPEPETAGEKWAKKEAIAQVCAGCGAPNGEPCRYCHKAQIKAFDAALANLPTAEEWWEKHRMCREVCGPLGEQFCGSSCQPCGQLIIAIINNYREFIQKQKGKQCTPIQDFQA